MPRTHYGYDVPQLPISSNNETDKGVENVDECLDESGFITVIFILIFKID